METILMILGLTLAGALGLGVIWVLATALRNTLQNPHRKQRVRARPTRTGGIEPGETVLLVGVIEPAQELLTAPFSGRRCVGYQAAVERDLDPYDSDNVLGGITRQQLPATVLLKDEEGAVLVQLSPDSPLGTERRKGRSLRDVPMEAVDGFLARFGATSDQIDDGFPSGCSRLPSGYRAVEWLLVEGDRVSVVGQAQLQPEARAADLSGGPGEPPGRLVVGPEAGLAVQLNAREDEVSSDAGRRPPRTCAPE